MPWIGYWSLPCGELRRVEALDVELIDRGLLAVLNRSPGHKREFSLNDISIQHTFAVHERVPPK